MAFGDFLKEVGAGRGFQAITKEANRLGQKALPGVNNTLRLGAKATGTVSRIGHKVSDVAKMIQPFVGPVPIVGNVVSAVGTGAGALAGISDTAGKAIGIGQNIVRTGASAFNNASSPGDIMATARDIQRQGGEGMKTLGDLQKQVKSMGSTLQRRKP